MSPIYPADIGGQRLNRCPDVPPSDSVATRERHWRGSVMKSWMCGLVVVVVASCKFDRPPPISDPDATPTGFRVGGTVDGMWDGAELTLQLSGDGLDAPAETTVAANGSFEFDAELVDGAVYEVSVSAAPAEHTCEVLAGSGAIATADVVDVAVGCTGPAVDVAFSAPIPLAFDAATLSYALDISIVMQETRVTVTAPAATNIRINEVNAYDSGQTTPVRLLVPGENTYDITVEVGEASRNYTIVLDRGAAEIEQFLYGKADNLGINDTLGRDATSIAISGDTLVVGAPGEASGNGMPNDNSADGAGAAYVFRRTGETWVQEAYLKASAIDQDDQFGTSVAISGDTIAVGATKEDSNATGVNGNDENDSLGEVGAVYVFRRTGSSWTQEAYVKPSTSATLTLFGRSVALAGNTLAVGAAGLFGGADNVHVFTRSGTTWTQQARLVSANHDSADQFGISVALSGESLAVGAPAEDSCATGINSNLAGNNECLSAGAAYLFVRSGTTWAQQAYIKASNTGAEDRFGLSVSLDGATLVVGAPEEDSSSAQNPTDNSATDRGAAYVFARSGITWGQVAFLKSSDVTKGFGGAVATRGDLIAIGAADSSTGVVSLFRFDTTWTQLVLVQAMAAQAGDNFSSGVALFADTLAVSAPRENSLVGGINPTDDLVTGGLSPGAVYAFR